MTEQRRKQLLLIGGALGATLLVLSVSFLIYDLFNLRIVHQDPQPNGIFPLSATVVVEMNKPLADISKQSVSIFPQVQGEWRVDGNRLLFQPQSLFSPEKYTVTLEEIVAEDGLSLSSSFSFTADRNASFTDEQIEQGIEQTDNLEKEYDVIAKGLVPYRASDYVIDFELPGGEEERMSLIISFTPPEYVLEDEAEYKQFVTEAERAARKYLTDNGINLDDYLVVIINQYDQATF